MKVYVIYETYEEDYTLINNLQVHYNCTKVFNDKEKALNWLYDELKKQCNTIKSNEETIYMRAPEKQEFGVAYMKEDKDLIETNIYHNDEWQSTIYIKEMEVE